MPGLLDVHTSALFHFLKESPHLIAQACLANSLSLTLFHLLVLEDAVRALFQELYFSIEELHPCVDHLPSPVHFLFLLLRLHELLLHECRYFLSTLDVRYLDFHYPRHLSHLLPIPRSLGSTLSLFLQSLLDRCYFHLLLPLSQYDGMGRIALGLFPFSLLPRPHRHLGSILHFQ